MFRFSYFITVVGIAVAALSMPNRAWSGENLVSEHLISIPVQIGDDLITALRRIQPCLETPVVRIPSQVFEDNPERVNRRGRMELVTPQLKIPDDWLNPQVQCGSVLASAVTMPAAPAGFADVAKAPVHLVDPAHPMTAEELDDERDRARMAREPVTNNHLSLMGIGNFTHLVATIASTNARPIFNSSPQFGFEVIYTRDLNTDWALGLDYVFVTSSLKNVSSNAYTSISGRRQEFQALANYRVTRATRISLLAGAAQIDELSLGSAGILVVDSALRLNGTILLLHDLGKLYGFGVWGAIGGNVFIPTNFSPAAVGVGELLRFYFDRPLGTRWTLKFEILGSYERQETKIESHSVLSGSLGLGLGFKF